MTIFSMVVLAITVVLNIFALREMRKLDAQLKKMRARNEFLNRFLNASYGKYGSIYYSTPSSKDAHDAVKSLGQAMQKVNYDAQG